MEQVAANTNSYAQLKNAAAQQSEFQQRGWTNTTASELYRWIALIVYMSVVRNSGSEKCVEDYWSVPKEDNFIETEHHPMKKGGISLIRFEQIKRFFHISPPQMPSSDRSTAARQCKRRLEQQPLMYDKLEPLASRVAESAQTYLIPATELSVDEMIVKFKGRSGDTNKFNHKPIKKGHKVFALCWRGYTWDWRYSSRSRGIINLAPQTSKKLRQNYSTISSTCPTTSSTVPTTSPKLPPVEITDSDLPPTSRMVLRLAESLPTDKLFHLYMDNYFTSVPLFQALRQRNIGAAGTAKTNAKGYPKEFTETKQQKVDLPWNTLRAKSAGDGQEETILALVWS